MVAVAPSVVQCAVLKCKRKPEKWKAGLQGLLFFLFFFFVRGSSLYSSMCMLTPVFVAVKHAEISVKSCTRVK